MKRTLHLIAALAAFVVSNSAEAQQSNAALSVGDRIRLKTEDAATHTGSLLEYSYEGLRLQKDGSSVELKHAWKDVVVLEKSLGGSRIQAAFKGYAVGAYLGGATGLLVGSMRERGVPWSKSVSMVTLGVGGTISGGAAGAILGAVIGRERWQRFKIILK